MAEATHLRLALAQIDPTVGDIEGNARLISESIDTRPGPRRAARAARPSSASPATRPRTCCCAGTSWTRAARRSTPSPRRSRASSPWSASRSASSGPPDELEDFDPLIDPLPPPAYNSLAVLADGEVRGDLPQVRPAQLRGLRRAPLLRAGHGAGPDRDRRRARRPDRLRGHLAPRLSREETRRRRAPRLVVNSSASPYHRGKGRAREGMVAERATRQRRGLRPLQHGRRPGRAGLRRGQRRGRPRRRDARAGGAVRARAAGLRSALAAGGRTDGASAARSVPVLAELSSGAQPEGHVEPRLAEPLPDEEAEVYAALDLGPARLRREERLRARRARPLGRDRLGPGAR